jgi:hypothetical protein
MRRRLVSSVAICLAGGVALAGDQPVAPPPAQPIIKTGPSAPSPDVAPPSPSLAGEPVVATAPVNEPTPDFYDGRFFGSVDYVVGWVRRNPTPPLVQIIPNQLANFQATGSGLPPGAGRTVFGGNGTDPGTFSGIRAYGGFYFDDCKTWGVDGSYYELFQRSQSFGIFSAGSPVIGRAYFDAADNQTAFLRYTTPDGLTSGNIRADAPVKVYTFDVNLRKQGPSMLSDRVDYLGGFRYMQLKDSTTVDSAADILDPNTGVPFIITSHEGFHAKNEFYGPQVGLETHYRWGCFSIEFTGKFAAGWVDQKVDIEGGSTTQVGNAPVQSFPSQSVLFVQPTNAGNHNRSRFAVLPEGMVQLGWQITPHCRATFGYDVYVLSSVERSGMAINENVNPVLTKYIQTNATTTVRQPAFSWDNANAWWTQGLTAGLAFNY